MQTHLHPMLLDNTFALLTRSEYKIGTTYSLGLPPNEQSVSIHVNIYQIKKSYPFDESLKGSNMIPSTSIIKGYYYLPDPDADGPLYMLSQKVMISKIPHLSYCTSIKIHNAFLLNGKERGNQFS